MVDSNDFLKSKFIVFLSIDIINSSTIKSQNVEWLSNDGWLNNALKFYQAVPEAVDFVWHKLNNEPKNLPPIIWKSLGDEVIFKKEVHTIDSLECMLNMWLQVADIIEKELNIKVKITAWSAGFPIINTEIARPLDPKILLEHEANGDPILQNLIFLKQSFLDKEGNNYLFEYVGPSIDIGFRLTKFSDKQKFIISVEIANLLSSKNNESIYFLEVRPIKSILNDYPIFWLARKSYSKSIESTITKPMPPKAVYKYTNDFLVNAETLCIPYISENSSGLPAEHQHKKQLLLDYLYENTHVTIAEETNAFKTIVSNSEIKLPDISLLMKNLT